MRAEHKIDRTVEACQIFRRLLPFDGGVGPSSRFSQTAICLIDCPARNRSAISRITTASSGMRMPPRPYPYFGAPCHSPRSAFCLFARLIRSALCPDSYDAIATSCLAMRRPSWVFRSNAPPLTVSIRIGCDSTKSMRSSNSRGFRYNRSTCHATIRDGPSFTRSKSSK